MMNRFLILVFVGLSLLCCTHETVEESKDAMSNGSAVQLLTSTLASNEANLLRSPTYCGAFEIVKAIKVHATLQVTVSYSSCGEGDLFQVIWNGVYLKTNPETVVLYLKKSGSCPSIQQPLSRVLAIDLTSLLGDATLAQRVQIMLCNSSKVANAENADIPVALQ